MKALTIQQPYAAMICLPDEDPDAKRVENRTWRTSYRGPLLIHASKSRARLESEDLERWPHMAFGAIVAVAQLVGCVDVCLSEGRLGPRPLPPEWANRKWPWLAAHRHTEGPVCWVLQEVRRLAEPVPCKGEPGLWDPPAWLLAAVQAQLQ